MKGSFYKRGKAWAFQVDIGPDKNGKRKRIGRSGFPTKKAAQAEAAKIINEVEEKTFIVESDIYFRTFADKWLEMYKALGKKESSVRSRDTQIKELASKLDCKIKDVTGLVYQEALNELSKEYCKNTLDGIHTTGKMIFSKAIELGIIKKNPTTYAKKPLYVKTVDQIESESEIPKFLEKDELKRLLNAAEISHLRDDYFIFSILAYSGIRVGELCLLKEQDFLVDTQEVSITKTLYEPGGILKYKALPPKTKSSIRKIPIEPFLFDELKKQKVRIAEDKMKHRQDYHDEGYVFTQPRRNPGYPMSTKMVRIRMKALLEAAGLDTTLTPHSLRHTHVSLLAAAGVNLPEIQERMGHIDDKTTSSIYLHVTKNKKREASQKFAQLLQSP